jgi:crotonobetainyl-CoA:carnitine CoA-transferase CaiB-like acyl-CoA transferase
MIPEPAASSDTLPEKATALAGIRICDLGGILAGAGATRIFAALGAQVIRVEDPVNKGRWDIVRGAGPFVDDRRGIDLGGTFNNHNVEKLGVTINLRQPAGKDLLRRLVAISDVVTENFSAGVMDRLGFGYQQLREINERIIYVANSGFGKTGRYAKYKSFGPIVQAVSGLTFTSALPDQPPAGWGFSYMDHMGANFMALAILGALVKRNRTGRGTEVDMSCTDAGLALAGPDLLDFTVNGRAVRESGSVNSNADSLPLMVPHGIYPAAAEDTWVAIACRDDDDWMLLAAAIGEDWAHDTRLDRVDGRLAEREDIEKRVAAWTAQRPAEEVRDALRRSGVPCAKVASPPDRVDHDPATARWGLWPTVRHTEMGEVRVDGMPMHLSETDWVIARGAPCLGEHNGYVFGELLGLSSDEIDEHVASGVI